MLYFLFLYLLYVCGFVLDSGFFPDEHKGVGSEHYFKARSPVEGRWRNSHTPTPVVHGLSDFVPLDGEGVTEAKTDSSTPEECPMVNSTLQCPINLVEPQAEISTFLAQRNFVAPQGENLFFSTSRAVFSPLRLSLKKAMAKRIYQSERVPLLP